MSYYTHAFEGLIDRLDIGKTKTVTYHVLFLPDSIEADLPFETYPRLRVEGEIADCPVRGAWNPVGDGRRYFIVSSALLKTAGLRVGEQVEMRFRIDDQDRVDVPVPLCMAIDASAVRAKLWSDLTPGKQRMFAHHVGSAKTAPTIQKRVNEALGALDAGMTLRDWLSSEKIKPERRCLQRAANRQN